MEVSMEWFGLLVRGNVTVGWEGDPTIPMGARKLYSVDDMTVDADRRDFIDYLNDRAIDEIEIALIEEAQREGL